VLQLRGSGNDHDKNYLSVKKRRVKHMLGVQKIENEFYLHRQILHWQQLIPILIVGLKELLVTSMGSKIFKLRVKISLLH
jgi:hypothetical protein